METTSSLKSVIAARKRSARRYATFNAITAGSLTTVLLLTPWTPLSWLMAGGAATMGVALILNSYSWLECRNAQRVYRDNPAAAYIAEIQHAFGPGN